MTIRHNRRPGVWVGKGGRTIREGDRVTYEDYEGKHAGTVLALTRPGRQRIFAIVQFDDGRDRGYITPGSLKIVDGSK
jgi:hypothetical protein